MHMKEKIKNCRNKFKFTITVGDFNILPPLMSPPTTKEIDAVDDAISSSQNYLLDLTDIYTTLYSKASDAHMEHLKEGV